MDLSIITVSYKVREKLRENLNALLQSEGGIEFEVIVADNDSQDGTIEMLKKEFPQVKLIDNQENLGYGKGNNQGLELATGEFILFLNPDMRVRPDTLVKALAWMRENPQAAVAGCRLVDEKGGNVPHVRRFPRLADQSAIILKLPHIFPGILNGYLRNNFDYSRPACVDSIRGAFFLICPERIKKLEITGSDFTIPRFDERYFLWFEEVDYCRQVKDSGGEVWYTPAAVCLDHVGQSFRQVGRGVKQNYFRDSMLKYFRKWGPQISYLILAILWPIGIITAKALTILGMKDRVRT